MVSVLHQPRPNLKPGDAVYARVVTVRLACGVAEWEGVR